MAAIVPVFFILLPILALGVVGVIAVVLVREARGIRTQDDGDAARRVSDETLMDRKRADTAKQWKS